MCDIDDIFDLELKCYIGTSASGKPTAFGAVIP